MDEDDFPAWPAHEDDDQPDESAPADEAKEEGETASEDAPSDDGSDGSDGDDGHEANNLAPEAWTLPVRAAPILALQGEDVVEFPLSQHLNGLESTSLVMPRFKASTNPCRLRRWIPIGRDSNTNCQFPSETDSASLIM